MKEDIYEAYILLLSGIAQMKNAKEIKCCNKYGSSITVEFPYLTLARSIVRYYYSNGNIYRLDEYKNGKMHGLSLAWYESGNIFWKYKHKNGLLHGFVFVYNEDGSIRDKKKYKDGVWIRD